LAGDVSFLTTTLVAIDVVLAGLFWSLMAEDNVLGQLIRKVLYVGFFALLLNNFASLADVIFSSFAGLGLKASAATISATDLMRPGFVAATGFKASQPLLDQAGSLMGFTSFFDNVVTITVLLIAWLIVLLAFFILSVQLFITIIEFKLTTLADFVLVPFALFGKTSFLAERVLGNVMTSGIKLMVLAIIVGVGSTLFGTISAPPTGDITLEQAASHNLEGYHLLIVSKETTAVLFVIAAAGAWGLTGVLSKYLLGAAAPMIVVLIQLISSTLVSWVIIAIKFEEVEISGEFLLASALGVLHPGLSTTLGIVGLVHLDASISSTIWALEAAMTMVLASMMLGERLSVIQIALTIVSVGGVFFTTMSGDQTRDLAESLYGASLVLIAVACCALYAVFSRQISKDSAAEPLPFVTGQQTTGLLVSLAMFPFHWSADRLGDLNAISIDILVVCALTGTLAFLVAMGLFLAALRYLSAGFASSFLILTPIFGLASAFLLLGEVLTGWQWIGVTIILMSVLGIQCANAISDR